MQHATAMSGPEFLEAVAHAERGNSNDVNAGYFEQRAQEWKLDKAKIELLERENSRLQGRIGYIRGLTESLLVAIDAHFQARRAATVR